MNTFTEEEKEAIKTANWFDPDTWGGTDTQGIKRR